MLMCLCSRVASGRVVRSPGLKKRGFVAGDNLQPWKARLLLSLALTDKRCRRDPADVRYILTPVCAHMDNHKAGQWRHR